MRFLVISLSLAEEFHIVHVGDVLETDFQEAASIYREAFPELSEEEAELQETQEVDMGFDNEDDAPDDENKIHEQASIKEDKCEAEQVCFLPTKVVEKHKKPESETEGQQREAKEGYVRECRMCGWEISEDEYKTQNGLCYTCWKRRVEVSERDPVSDARRGGLLGADRAGTW